MSIQPARTAPFALAGRVLGAAFGAVGVLRRQKPLHPRGALLTGRLRRHGAQPPLGLRWLDESGEHDVLVRFSRSIGLPARAPDIQGLAIRIPGERRPSDLLLATTGRGPVGRHCLVPHGRPGAALYSSLFPYQGAGRLLVLAAEPVEPRVLPSRTDALAEELADRPFTIRLLVALLGQEWRPFATLRVGGRATSVTDPEIRFDPVLHPLPELSMPPWARSLREPSYAAARR